MLSSGQIDFSIDYPEEEVWRIPKMFCKRLFKKINVHSRNFIFFISSSGDVEFSFHKPDETKNWFSLLKIIEFSFDKPDRKIQPKIDFYSGNPWISLKSLYGKRCFSQNKTSEHVEWSTVFLDNIAEN